MLWKIKKRKKKKKDRVRVNYVFYKLGIRLTSSENREILKQKRIFIVYISISVGMQKIHMVCSVEDV
jgi:hypothetical protein